MEEQIDLKLFTVADLKQYFVHNQPVDLLTDEVITRSRAFATIHNPYVTDDMAVVSALFVDRKIVAYTYVFPDQLVRPDKLIFWNTVLYVDKAYEGRGYGAIVIGQMVEVYGDAYFDLDAVPASVGNLQFAGLQVDYVDQYYLEKKHINTSSVRGKMADIVEQWRMCHNAEEASLRTVIENADYELRYVNDIDDDTYAFILNHSKKDLFLRSQDMFNWILTYPMAGESPLVQRVQDSCYFHSITPRFRRYAVQVRYANQLVGFYIFRDTENELYIEYLYMSEDHEQVVYASIAEHVLQFRRNKFFTADKRLATWLNGYHLYAHFNVYHKSFSHPKEYVWTEDQLIQAGDGDNII